MNFYDVTKQLDGKSGDFKWPDEVTNAGIKRINKHFLSVGMPTLPRDEFQVAQGWHLNNSRNGRLSVRIRRFLADRYDLNKPDMDAISKACEIAQAYSGDGGNVHYDFVSKSFWRAGEFGESTESCYWNSYRYARVHITDFGGLALRSFEDQAKTKGLGRAWVVPQDDCLIVFNGYGRIGTRTASARHFAGLLAVILDKRLGIDAFIAKAELHAPGLYVNDQGICYAVSNRPMTEGREFYLSPTSERPETIWSNGNIKYYPKREKAKLVATVSGDVIYSQAATAKGLKKAACADRHGLPLYTETGEECPRHKEGKAGWTLNDLISSDAEREAARLLEVGDRFQLLPIEECDINHGPGIAYEMRADFGSQEWLTVESVLDGSVAARSASSGERWSYSVYWMDRIEWRNHRLTRPNGMSNATWAQELVREMRNINRLSPPRGVTLP